jgi:hypothetical protein
MTVTAGDDGPIELHLADGGHVILAIEDPAMRASADGDRLVEILVRADGSEHDVERAIQEVAEGLGLSCVPSLGHHATILTIQR